VENTGVMNCHDRHNHGCVIGHESHHRIASSET
jgi:hypothetical protein